MGDSGEEEEFKGFLPSRAHVTSGTLLLESAEALGFRATIWALESAPSRVASAAASSQDFEGARFFGLSRLSPGGGDTWDKIALARS
jgi:hypothetical protein